MQRSCSAQSEKDAAELSRRISALEAMSRDELRGEWVRVIKAHPFLHLSSDLLRRGIAHRLQEATLGRCSGQTLRKLGAAASGSGAHSETTGSLKNGTTLIREWHGRTYIVRVLEDGLVYDGKRFDSLTRIAREITGAAWSGPRFFGIVAAGKAARIHTEHNRA